jgi:hypothetical protein
MVYLCIVVYVFYFESIEKKDMNPEPGASDLGNTHHPASKQPVSPAQS